MKLNKALSAVLILSMTVSLCACSNSSNSSKSVTPKASVTKIDTDLSSYKQDNKTLTFDNSKWNYDKDNDVYWQISVGYCSKPETKDYETLGIYVPGAYINASANGDGTYTCKINTKGKVGNYTASTAPIVFPVNTGGYAAQEAPTSYSYDGLSSYLKAGFVYVYAGMRGRDNGYDSNKKLIYSGGAPWGVTDLKAAVRYYRYNADSLPGNTNSIFTFGMSGGGAQSSLMGATGDSKLYYDYLESIGSAMYDKNGKYISDAVTGAMCWCPITSLDYADEAYEWNMGQFSSSDTRALGTWTSALSKDLANSYADYINKLKIKDENGNVLTLEKSSNGIYTAGSYYDYLVSEVEQSLNNFLSDTTFPYTPSNNFKMDGGFGGEMKGKGALTDNGAIPSGAVMHGGEAMHGGAVPSGEAMHGGATTQGQNSKLNTAATSKTYKTVQEYIKSLNTDETWIKYDSKTNTAKITSMQAFITHCKNASKAVGAFDDLSRSQAENNLFGNDDNEALHFDSVLANLLQTNKDKYSKYTGWDSSVVDAYASDLKAVDKFGNSIQERLNMYNPMYYLSNYYDGYGASTVAKYWRIRTGIDQGDTALTVETNLALALKQTEGVKNVDFATVWGQQHTTAERTGDSTQNFVAWVNECASK